MEAKKFLLLLTLVSQYTYTEQQTSQYTYTENLASPPPKVGSTKAEKPYLQQKAAMAATLKV
jgi:hypothetical protein